MAGYKCPFCKEIMSITDQTKQEHGFRWSYGSNNTDELLVIEIYRCPNPECEKFSVIVKGSSNNLKGLNKYIWPMYTCNHYPKYVPDFIQKDYQEAGTIVELSPKASATLSRRCLQEMIEDFWKIKEHNLYQEIQALKGKVDDEVITALLNLKSIGNIGAHPKISGDSIVDVDADEATKLIELIEHLIDDWYIAREKRKCLFSHLKAISENKKNPHSSTTDSN